jgi:hypothetical protein
MSFRYTVGIDCAAAAVHARFLTWLEHVHIAEVLAAGASGAELLELAASAPGRAHGTIEVRYRFATRGAFEAYLREHAPGLRASGLAQLEPGDQVQFTRSAAELIAAFG